MFQEHLFKLIGTSTRGWKTTAAALLGVSRPTLDRYIKLSEQGRLDKIPQAIWDKVGGYPIGTSNIKNAKSQVGGTEFDMLNLFAAGLCQLQEEIDHHGHIQAPYPEPLSRAFNIAAAFNIEVNTTYPTDLASLILAANKPIFEWCCAYGQSEHGESFITSTMLEGGEVTPDCISMAGLSEKDAEQAFYQMLMSVCSELDNESGQNFYSAWRQAVIENPVAESHAIFIAKYEVLRNDVIRTRRLVDFFFEKIPEFHAENGKLALCPLTGTRLKKHEKHWITEMRDPIAVEHLRKHGPRWIDHTPATIELKRPVRVFWALPGWHELQLYHAVQTRGYKSILWPNFDSYDLLVTHTSGKKFAVDVKDHISPISLSKMSGEDNRRRHYKRIIVIPDYLEARLPQYKIIFNRSRLSHLKDPEQIMTIREFVDLLGEQK